MLNVNTSERNNAAYIFDACIIRGADTKVWRIQKCSPWSPPTRRVLIAPCLPLQCCKVHRASGNKVILIDVDEAYWGLLTVENWMGSNCKSRAGDKNINIYLCIWCLTLVGHWHVHTLQVGWLMLTVGPSSRSWLQSSLGWRVIPRDTWSFR